MLKSEELKREKYRFIIYHGHIHILAKNDDYEDQDILNDKKFPKF